MTPSATIKSKPHNYDKTQARRQAKRRAQFTRMRQALRAIADAATLDEARALARDGLADIQNEEAADDDTG